MWRKGNPLLLVGMQTDTATVESSMEIPQKLKMDLPFDPLPFACQKGNGSAFWAEGKWEVIYSHI